MSEKLSVEARAVMDLTARENATYLDVLAAVTRMEAAAEERGRRAGVGEATGALTEARDALEQVWAAIGDRLCGKGPLAKEYAQAVASKADAAAKRIRALAPRDPGKGNT